MQRVQFTSDYAFSSQYIAGRNEFHKIVLPIAFYHNLFKKQKTKMQPIEPNWSTVLSINENISLEIKRFRYHFEFIV